VCFDKHQIQCGLLLLCTWYGRGAEEEKHFTQRVKDERGIQVVLYYFESQSQGHKVKDEWQTNKAEKGRKGRWLCLADAAQSKPDRSNAQPFSLRRVVYVVSVVYVCVRVCV